MTPPYPKYFTVPTDSLHESFAEMFILSYWYTANNRNAYVVSPARFDS